jgi:cytochrome c biogenesis protein CcdA
VIDAPLAFAFGVGMVAAFNPCGFAMLPAYLAYFLGLEDREPDASASVFEAIRVSAVMTAGFVLVFGSFGVLVTWSTLSVERWLPWVTMVIGVIVAGLGVAFLLGKELTVGLPKLEKGGSSRHLGSIFLFGISYAVASLSCSIAVFLAATTFSLAESTFVSRVAAFIAYGAGMGLMVAVLTLAVALAKTSFVARLRGAMPAIHRISGVLLVLSGLLIVYLGYFDYRLVVQGDDIGGPASRVFETSGEVSGWVQDVGPTRLGLVLAGVVATALVLAWGWRASRPPSPTSPSATSAPPGPDVADDGTSEPRLRPSSSSSAAP